MRTWLRRLVRRWTLRQDARDPRVPTDLPLALQRVQVGECLPWKGTTFKVGKVIGGDFPCIILVPNGLTRGAKLRGLRNARDTFRAVRDERRAIAAALKSEAS